HAKAVYPLYQLVDAQNLPALQAQLKLDSSLRLVDSCQLKASGLKGDVTLSLDIDDFAQSGPGSARRYGFCGHSAPLPSGQDPHRRSAQN
ncbi:hypothetical protein, partial [Klebsiella pneumoniae]|uniref:hypothetical protein n=1 Tax=Klebsiella pneumoniae TaxID=573 RepID=UPI00376EE6BC